MGAGNPPGSRRLEKNWPKAGNTAYGTFLCLSTFFDTLSSSLGLFTYNARYDVGDHQTESLAFHLVQRFGSSTKMVSFSSQINFFVVRSC